MQETENHPLLNITEFKARVEAFGPNSMVAGNLFGALARHALWGSEERTSEDLAYRESNREGDEETVISIPNLKVAISEHQKIRNVGPRLVAICVELIKHFSQDDISPSL